MNKEKYFEKERPRKFQLVGRVVGPADLSVTSSDGLPGFRPRCHFSQIGCSLTFLQGNDCLEHVRGTAV